MRRLSGRWLNYLKVVGILFVLLSFSFPIKAYAKETGSITVTDWPVEGTVFRLYRVADLNGTEFSASRSEYVDLINGHDVVNMSNQQLIDLADELEAVIEKDQIAPDDSLAYSLSSRNCFYNLDSGFYLVKGDTAVKNGTTYIPQISLISVPDKDLKYEVVSELKFSSSTSPEPVPSETPVPKPTPTPQPQRPDTGDRFNSKFYAIVIAVDAAVVILYFVLYRKQSKQDGE